MNIASPLLSLIAALTEQEGEKRVLAFADALDLGRVSPQSTAATLQAVLGLTHTRLQLYRQVLFANVDVNHLVVALRASAVTAARILTTQPTVEVAWTYPGDTVGRLRSTGGVAREVIDGSQRTLFVVGYAVTVDPALAGLAAQTIETIASAARRGVVVTAVLHRQANRQALLQAWKPGALPPEIFTWPETDDPQASMHAKLLIADQDDALVTSANLTYHGFEGNLEMGVRVIGRAAGEMQAGIQKLISSGQLIPWH